MNNNEAVKVTTRSLTEGDYLAGSQVTITRRPYTSVKCPKGRLWVEGTRANGEPFLGCWNANTTLTVRR